MKAIIRYAYTDRVDSDATWWTMRRIQLIMDGEYLFLPLFQNSFQVESQVGDVRYFKSVTGGRMMVELQEKDYQRLTRSAGAV